MKLARVHLIGRAAQFLVVAPLWHAVSAASGLQPVLVHTGQHYEIKHVRRIFADLKLPIPD